MASEKQSAQLNKLKETLNKWAQELETYSKWAKENDNLLNSEEKKFLENCAKDVSTIQKRIKKLEYQDQEKNRESISVAEKIKLLLVEIQDHEANILVLKSEIEKSLGEFRLNS